MAYNRPPQQLQQPPQQPPMRPPAYPPPGGGGGGGGNPPPISAPPMAAPPNFMRGPPLAPPKPPPQKPPPQKPPVIQGWTEHQGPNGRSYWYNVASKQSVWEKPAALKNSAEIRLSLCPWKEFTNQANGKKYYHNKVTKESAWVKPKELEDIEKSLGIGVPAPPPAASGATLQPNPSIATNGVNNNNNNNNNTGGKITNIIPTVVPVAVTPVVAPPTQPLTQPPPTIQPPPTTAPAQTAEPPKPVLKDGLMYATKEEARAAFKEMLTDENVSADWNWDKVKRAIALKPKYNALKREGERKQAWRGWQPLRAKLEKEENQQKQKLKRSQLQELILMVGEIGVDTTYRQAAELLRTHHFFKNIKNDRDRQDVFKDAIHMKITQQKNAERDLKRKMVSAAKDVVMSIPSPVITVTTTWEKARELIRESDVFKSHTDLVDCHDSIVLEAFQIHIESLQREMDDAKREERAEKRRRLRYARSDFKTLLDEMQKLGMLNAGSLWKEHVRYVVADPRYTALLNECEHRDDLLPISFFKLRIEELKESLKEDRKLLRLIMTDADFKVNSDTTLEEYHQALCADPRYTTLPTASIRLCHKLSVEDAVEDELIKKEKLKQCMRNFTEMLEYNLKRITKGQTWEEVATQFSRQADYQDLDDDDLRKTLFDAFTAEDPWARRSRSSSRSPKSRRRRSRSSSASDSDDDHKHRKKKHKKDKKDKKEKKSKKSSKNKKRKHDSSDDDGSDSDLESKRTELLAKLSN